MLWRRFADRNERAVRLPFHPADAPHGVALERAVDVRKPPFTILILHRRRHPLQIDLDDEVRSRIVPVVAVSHLDHGIMTMGAMDESFAGEPFRLVSGLVFLGQPDLFGNEMERRYRSLLTVAVIHAVEHLTISPVRR